MTTAHRCTCPYCEMSRALGAKRLNRKRLDAAYEHVFNRSAYFEAEYAHLFREVWESIKAGEDMPERIAEAFRLVAKGTAADPEVERKRYRVVAMPTFVEQYGELTGRTKREARSALKGIGIDPHLLSVDAKAKGGER